MKPFFDKSTAKQILNPAVYTESDRFWKVHTDNEFEIYLAKKAE